MTDSVPPAAPAPLDPSPEAVEAVRETLIRMGIAAAAKAAFGQTHFDATCLMVARNVGAVQAERRDQTKT